jgi:hypothetical protein
MQDKPPIRGNARRIFYFNGKTFEQFHWPDVPEIWFYTWQGFGTEFANPRRFEWKSHETHHVNHNPTIPRDIARSLYSGS